MMRRFAAGMALVLGLVGIGGTASAVAAPVHHASVQHTHTADDFWW